ncbi:MAG: redoxin domain-containing protein [Bacteroidia bacterium]|nr:redoxin domain-containing protein [Bacteroidia bacterium]MDW8301943.1 redoxin domain-containing protein [Bacteroidia bacterium]
MHKFIRSLFLVSTMWLSNVYAQEEVEGLKIGDKAPQFVAVDNHAMPVYLNRLLKQGPVVLMFYHGSWSNSSLTQLRNLQDSLSLIYEMGGTVIAITTESMENIIKMSQKMQTKFPIISDKNRMISLRYKVGKNMEYSKVEEYKKRGYDIKNMTADGTAFVSMPATYVIGQDGIIKAAFVSKEYEITPTIHYIIGKLMEEGLKPQKREIEE